LRHNGEQTRYIVAERTANANGNKTNLEAPRGDGAYRAMLDRKLESMLAASIAAVKKRREKKR